MDLWNPDTFNIEGVLRANIEESEYFKRELQRVERFQEVIAIAKDEVSHVEPWMSGNARGPSTAFCILYKLFTIKLTVKQLISMVEEGETPYVRAIGFLYLRYGAEPKTLWWWFAKYLKDPEEFSPSATEPNNCVTIGAYCRDLLLDQYYFETIFPRIPEVIRRGFKDTLAKLNYNSEPAGCGGIGGTRRQTDDGTIAKRPQSVKAALSVNLAQRAPHLPSNREQGRGLDSTYSLQREEARKERDKQHNPEPSNQSNGRNRKPLPREKRRSRSRDSERRRHSRSKSRSRSRSRHRR